MEGDNESSLTNLVSLALGFNSALWFERIVYTVLRKFTADKHLIWDRHAWITWIVSRYTSVLDTHNTAGQFLHSSKPIVVCTRSRTKMLTREWSKEIIPASYPLHWVYVDRMSSRARKFHWHLSAKELKCIKVIGSVLRKFNFTLWIGYLLGKRVQEKMGW